MAALSSTYTIAAFVVFALVIIYLFFVQGQTQKKVDVLLKNIDSIDQITSLASDVAAVKSSPLSLKSITLSSSNLQNCSGVSLIGRSAALDGKTNLIFIQVSLLPTVQNTFTALSISNIDFSKCVLISCTDNGPAETTPSFSVSTGYLEFMSPLDPQQQTTIALAVLQSV